MYILPVQPHTCFGFFLCVTVKILQYLQWEINYILSDLIVCFCVVQDELPSQTFVLMRILTPRVLSSETFLSHKTLTTGRLRGTQTDFETVTPTADFLNYQKNMSSVFYYFRRILDCVPEEAVMDPACLLSFMIISEKVTLSRQSCCSFPEKKCFKAKPFQVLSSQ